MNLTCVSKSLVHGMKSIYIGLCQQPLCLAPKSLQYVPGLILGAARATMATTKRWVSEGSLDGDLRTGFQKMSSTIFGSFCRGPEAPGCFFRRPQTAPQCIQACKEDSIQSLQGGLRNFRTPTTTQLFDVARPLTRFSLNSGNSFWKKGSFSSSRRK